MTDQQTERVRHWDKIIVPLALAALLIGTSWLITVLVYVGDPIQNDPILSILWPWAAGAATIYWGLPFFKSLAGGGFDG